MSDDLKIRMPEWARNMYNRLIALIDAGGGGGGEVNRINSISLNGVNVPPDANKNVALAESDPTVPSWAKAATKPSYTAQEVGALPANTPIPSKTSDLTNDSGFLTSSTGVTGVKGNAENAYRQGNVNLTPANIGAVAKSGDIMTGPLTIGANIIQDRGFIKGQDGDNTNHALKLGHVSDDVMQFFEYGGQFDFYQSQNGTNTLLFQVKNGVSSVPLPVNNGGTGATTAADARANLEITPANIGAMGSTVKNIDFGSNASDFYANLNTELSSMSDNETKFLRFQPGVADGNFHAYHIFSGYITKINSSYAMGIFCSHAGDVIYLYYDSGSWNSKLLT